MRTKSHAKRPVLRAAAPLIQSLEPRQLFAAILDIGPDGALTYTGSGVDNNLKVSAFVTSYSISETAEPITLTQRAIDAGAFLHADLNVVTISVDKVSSLLINTALGDDTVNVNSIEDATTVNTSVGNGDVILVGHGPSGGSTNAIDGDLTLMDTGGSALVDIDDISSPPKIVHLDDNVFSGLAINGHTITLGSGITTLTWYAAYASTSNINITSTPSLQTLNLFGSTFDASHSKDTVNVLATPASLTTNIDTLGDVDYVTIGDGTTANILGTVNVSDTSAVNLFINDQASGVARNVVIDNGSITGVAPAAINYGAGVIALAVDLSSGADTVSFKQTSGDLKSVLLTGGAGGDTFKVTPSSVTTVTVIGGDPITPTTTPDILVLDLAGATGAKLTVATADSGAWTFADRKTITFAGIDGYDAANVREMVKALGLSSGHQTALLAKLNLKGTAEDVGKLSAFISLVDNLLKGGQISAAEAEALTQAANVLLLAVQQ